MPDSFVDSLVIASLFTFLTGPLLKSMVLIWAYVKTRRLAAICYAVFLLIEGILPITFGVLGSAPPSAGLVVLGWVLDVGLFTWLIISFVRRWQNPSTGRSRKPVTPPVNG